MEHSSQNKESTPAISGPAPISMSVPISLSIPATGVNNDSEEGQDKDLLELLQLLETSTPVVAVVFFVGATVHRYPTH